MTAKLAATRASLCFIIVHFLLLALSARASDYTSGLVCSADGSQVYLTRLIGIFVSSTNSGLTWQTNSDYFGYRTSVACSADGAKLVAGVSDAIHTSSDGGKNWTVHSTPGMSWRAAASSADGSQLIVAGGLVMTSTNQGASWKTNDDLPARSWTSLASSANGKILAAAADIGSQPSGIFTSTNAGASWISNDLPIGLRWHSIACSADGSKLVAGTRFSGSAGVFLSENSGKTWSKVTNGPSNGAVKCSADGSAVMVASFSNSGPDVNGRLYRSTDFGLTWTALSLTGFAYPPALATSADANRAYTQQSYFQSGIEVVQFPVQPALKFARLSETNCALSWTVPSSNFVAERASDLSGSNWIDLGATPVLTGYDHRIVLSSNLFASTNAQFFRLRSFPSP